jgi:hypothetical protein
MSFANHPPPLLSAALDQHYVVQIKVSIVTQGVNLHLCYFL